MTRRDLFKLLLIFLSAALASASIYELGIRDGLRQAKQKAPR